MVTVAGCFGKSQRLSYVRSFDEETNQNICKFSNLVKNGKLGPLETFHELVLEVSKIAENCLKEAYRDQDFSYLLRFSLVDLDIRKITEMSKSARISGSELLTPLRTINKIYQKATNIDRRFRNLALYCYYGKPLNGCYENVDHPYKLRSVTSSNENQNEIEEFVGLVNNFPFEIPDQQPGAIKRLKEIFNKMDSYFLKVHYLPSDYSIALFYGNLKLDLDKAKKLHKFLKESGQSEFFYPEGDDDCFDNLISNYVLARKILYNLAQAVKSEYQFDALGSALSASSVYPTMIRFRDEIEEGGVFESDVCKGLSLYLTAASQDLTAIFLFSNIVDLEILRNRIGVIERRNPLSSDLEPLNNIYAHVANFNSITTDCLGLTKQFHKFSDMRNVEGLDVRGLNSPSRKVRYLKPMSYEERCRLKAFNEMLEELSSSFFVDVFFNPDNAEEVINSFDSLLKGFYIKFYKTNQKDFSYFLHINSSISLDMENLDKAIEKLDQLDKNLAKKLTKVKKEYQKIQNLVLSYYAVVSKYYPNINVQNDEDDHKE